MAQKDMCGRQNGALSTVCVLGIFSCLSQDLFASATELAIAAVPGIHGESGERNFVLFQFARGDKLVWVRGWVPGIGIFRLTGRCAVEEELFRPSTGY